MYEATEVKLERMSENKRSRLQPKVKDFPHNKIMGGVPSVEGLKH